MYVLTFGLNMGTEFLPFLLENEDNFKDLYSFRSQNRLIKITCFGLKMGKRRTTQPTKNFQVEPPLAGFGVCVSFLNS